MGPDGDGNAPTPMPQGFFNPEITNGLGSPVFGPLIREVGRNAKPLMGRRPGIEIRYFGDFFLPKLPAGKASSHGGNGETYFHQDYINWALDRSGGMTFWIALADLAPESGTMSFVSGSHRMGTLGNYRTFATEDVLEQYPELLEECTIEGPVSYRAGDATVHSNLCVHGAGANLTHAPRWAYAIIVNPSDARWNGGPAEAFDTSGMHVLQELDDQRFPIIS
jgi:ectoine hydroxylase-related dioxygenase (phytanoyl-CoA dioxygenase family)